MTEEGGSGTRLVCPACGRAREAGGRFCPGCGLDYWRLAAGGTVESAGGPGAPIKKSRFGRKRQPTPEPSPAPASMPVVPRPAAFARPGAPPVAPPSAPGRPAPAAAAPDGAAPVGTPSSGLGRFTQSLRIPESPRSRLIAGGVAAAIVLLIVALGVLRPSGEVASTTTPTPGPSTQAPDEVIAAFFKAVRDPAAAFEVKVNGTFTQTTRGKRATGSIVADVRVVGDSLAGTLRLTQPGAPAFSGSIVRIGLQSWTRAPGTAWRQQSLPAAADTLNPFAWIATVDDLTYVRAGPGQGGHPTEILQSTKWLSGTQFDDLILGLTDSQRDSRMEVEATDAGAPLHATYQFTIRGTVSPTEGSLQLSGSTEFTFSHWDEPSTIGPPA